MNGHTISLIVMLFAGYVLYIAVDKWRVWNNRTKNPVLGERDESRYQANLAFNATLATAAFLILACLSFAIPLDLMITITGI